MRMVRAGTLLVCAAVSLLGCAGSRLAPDPPAGLSLAGAWKLDRAASDDPQRVLARMRAEALRRMAQRVVATGTPRGRSEEHTSELQSLTNLVCRLLLEKKKQQVPK